MCFPVAGELKLAFVRYYNSFNDCDNGLGRGWEITPYALHFPNKKANVSFEKKIYPRQCYLKIIVRTGNSEDEYVLSGLDPNQNPLYTRQDGVYQLIEINHAGYVLFQKNLGSVAFDSEGKLTTIADMRGYAIHFSYQGACLKRMVHQDGRKIDLHYQGDRLVQVEGPGNKVIQFECNQNGQLISSNMGGHVTTYDYDQEQHLRKMTSPKSDVIFRAKYDSYHRIKEICFGKRAYGKQDYNLGEKRSKITLKDGSESTTQYDDRYRKTECIDALGYALRFKYHPTKNFGKPIAITNKLGYKTRYRYDNAGNISQLKNANKDVWYFLYDADNHLIATRNPTGNGEFYVYAQGKLTHCFHHASLELNDKKQLTGNVHYDPNIVTHYHYDGQTGDLLAVTDPEGVEKKFTYDSNGLPITRELSPGCSIENTYDERSRLRKKQMGKAVFTYEYDDLDRIAKVIAPSGDIQYEYDGNNNVTAIHDQRGNTTLLEYNDLNNLVKVVDAEGGVILYEYNEMNQLKKVEFPNHLIKEIEYDSLHRPIKQISKGIVL